MSALVPPTTTRSRHVEKWVILHLNLAQVRARGSQKLFAESGADSAAEFKLLAFIESDKQCAEVFFANRLDRCTLEAQDGNLALRCNVYS